MQTILTKKDAQGRTVGVSQSFENNLMTHQDSTHAVTEVEIMSL
jgi:hypothetical protein